ncbi:endoplasmic reticulum junction formation protein lunapark-B-like [Saccoglossus kowalevskii]|uniref:Endoplasmic reticulum junction formation protein lunapark n=1 Tax=Saccoglossus kowalevskii TaxID=10224 RepID=A0ABM0MC62_SACKO|nr:PREDICTED: protein lunapark-B-like [Saccoglossus kowalevskii]
MGAILARFRKKPSTMEVLESLDKDIQALFKFKRRNQQLEKHYIGMLLLYSIILYTIGTVVVYFYYFPNNWKGRLLCALPLLVFPFIYSFVCCLFPLVEACAMLREEIDLALEELLEKKKKMLEDVMEHETYKTAKEILEKYDPTFKKPESPPVRPQGRSPPGSAVRQRTPAARGMVGAPPGQGTPGQQMRLQRPITTPRPILPRDRGAVDKVVEYLVGDGPNYRYALICKICQSHNGMALAEEFEYLAFKCAYCNGMNPARKTKPNAPPLAVALHGGTPPPTPKRQHQGSQSQSTLLLTHQENKEVPVGLITGC